MTTAPLTPVSITFEDLRIGDEIRGFHPDTGTEYAGRIEDKSTHTLWIGRTHSRRLVVHSTDGHRFELVRPAPPAPWSQPTVACPSWCGGDQIDDEGGVIHLRRIGSVGVEISQTPDEPATIAWPADHEVADYPTADQAAQIGADLVEAARLLRGGASLG
ncbi:hypothetical protein ABLG96_13835 [Nakamurella sp. A5-74]|uniref:Uncharacterized protein n=1 Tax=Nakamurella sp. A5-74 TaxID=3158264 RepID=A0AAU8DJR6_9ACTN